MSLRPPTARLPMLVFALGIAAAFARFFPAPLAGLLAYGGLGLLPGLAFATGLGPGFSLGARVTIGLALSPLLATAASLLLLGAGVELRPAASIVIGLATVGYAFAERRRLRMESDATADPNPRGTPDGRFVLLWCVALGLATALPPLVNRYVAVRGDAWTHAGLVWEIIHRGVPPEDPKFAGLALNYVWFFHAFLALLVRASGDGPFFFMPLFNVVQAGLTASLAYRLGLVVWRERAAARGALVLVVLGFQAASYLLWPLGFVRGLFGHIRGKSELVEYLHSIKFPAAEIVYSLHAGYASMINFFDKLLTGTALQHGYALMMLYLWASVLWLGDGRADSLVLVLAATAGMLFFHGVVGLSFVPVMLGTLVVLWLARARWSWLPSTARLAALAAATGVGALLAAPYTWSITRGWAPDRSGLQHSYFGIGVVEAWTIVTACGVALWLARRPIRRTLERRLVLPLVLVVLAGGSLLFSCVVRLPGNNQTKFVFETFVPIAILGGAAWSDLLAGWRRRFGRLGTALVFAVVFLVNPLLTIAGFALDPAGATRPELNPRPGEARLYRWIRDETPVRAVFVDASFRDLITVQGQRELYLGTAEGPEKFAYPLAELERRRALVADVYGPAIRWREHRATLAALGRPTYVLFRLEDFPDRAPWRALDGDTSFDLAYDQDGYRVYRLRTVASP